MRRPIFQFNVGPVLGYKENGLAPQNGGGGRDCQPRHDRTRGITHRRYRLRTRFGMVAFLEKTLPARGIPRCDPICVVTHARCPAYDDAQAVEAS